MQDTVFQSMQVRFHYFGHGTDPVRLSIYTRVTIGGPMNLIDRFDNFATDSFLYTDQYLVVLNDFQVSCIRGCFLHLRYEVCVQRYHRCPACAMFLLPLQFVELNARVHFLFIEKTRNSGALNSIL